MADLARIKRNVAKMASMNAPKSDIDGYIASEGVSIEDVRNYKPQNEEKNTWDMMSRKEQYNADPQRFIDENIQNPIAHSIGTGLVNLNKGLGAIDYGLGRFTSGLSLGLSDKIVPENETYKPKGTAANAVGVGLEVAGSIPTSFGLLNKVGKIPYISKFALPIASAAEGGTREFIKSGDVEESVKQAGVGGAIGGALQGTGKLVKTFLPEILGITTGSGESSIRQAVDAGKRSSKKFLDNLRGKVNPSEIVDEARTALKDMKIAKNAQYANNTQALFESNKQLDLNPILEKVKNINAEYSVGGFSKAGKDTTKALNEINETVNEFSKNPNIHTVEGFDALKQRLNDITFNAEARQANKVVRDVSNSVKDEIVKQAPEYSKIMKDYSNASDAVQELEKTLSLGDKKTVDTALRKLQSAFRKNVSSNYGKREELVRKLGGEDLADAISGQMLSDVMPRGLVGRLAGAGTVTTGNVAALPAFSPRLIGESSYYLGKALNKTPKSTVAPYLQIGED